MFGFMKRALGRAKGHGGGDAPPILPEDLDNPARLGPKLAAHARQRAEVAGADYQPAIEAVQIRYHSGGEATMFLGNVLNHLRQAQSGAGIAGYLEHAFAEPVRPAEGYLLPVLQPGDYVERVMAQLQAAGAPADQEVPFWYGRHPAGFTVILVRDTPNRMSFQSEDDLAQAGLDMTAVRNLAIQDLARLCEDRELRVSKRNAGNLYQVQLDGNYEASTFLANSIWAAESDRLGAPVAAIFAARDVVIYGSSLDKDAMALLRQLASPEQEPPEFAIEPRKIVIWTETGWQAYQPEPDMQAAPN